MQTWPETSEIAVASGGVPVIEVENVSKRYKRQEQRSSLRHEALNIVQRIAHPKMAFQRQPFFALQNVSFSVHQSEAVAIVGRNGSGKTTLLRLLAGITQPTQGHIHVRGRFVALIGLGAGFLPDLPGRKNIYLNAALHGIAPRAVDAILEQIIDFSELGTFIDTPVKYYSSGMTARLAFSIAAHILPEIIFLDEVLAVGDVAFQQKCFERITQFKDEGRTLLFVSHSAASIRLLCERTIWLHDGRVMLDGPTDAVLERYTAEILADRSP